MALDPWLSAVEETLFGDRDKPQERQSRSLTWVVVDAGPDDEVDDCAPNVGRFDREPRGADDETVAAAIPSNEREPRARQRPTPGHQADDETVAEAIASIDGR